MASSNEGMSLCGVDGINLGPAANRNPMDQTPYEGVPDDGLRTWRLECHRKLIRRRRTCGNDSQLPNDRPPGPIKQRRGLYAQLIERDNPLEHSTQHGQTGNEEGSVQYVHA